MKKDAFYFPHFANARNDEKIIKLRRVFGMEGYGIYFAILEALREKEGFRLPIASLEDFAYDWHISKEKVYSIVADFDLFIIEESLFFSPKLIEFLQPYLEGKEKKRIGGIKGNLIKSGILTKEQASKLTPKQLDEIDRNRKSGITQIINTENTLTYSHSDSLREQDTETDTEQLPLRSASQMKVKESKVKESKVINTHSSNTKKSTCFSFEEFWEMYGKKKDRKKSETAYLKVPEKDRKIIKETLPKYIESTPDIQYRKLPTTYLNGKNWEDDLTEPVTGTQHNLSQGRRFKSIDEQ
jgi:hypothetical protein